MFCQFQKPLHFLYFYRQDRAKRDSAGIVFTQGPIFRPAVANVIPIKVKFGREERTVGPILSAKFHFDRLGDVGLRPKNFENLEFYQYNCP